MKLTLTPRRDFPVHPTVESDLSTISAAHRTLAVEELQYSTFSHLLVFYALSSRPDNRQDALVAVAQTCQSFLDIALNILYRHTTLFRLLQVWHGRDILKRSRLNSLHVGTDIVRTYCRNTPTNEFSLAPRLD